MAVVFRIVPYQYQYEPELRPNQRTSTVSKTQKLF
jgi:hypothetical protein